MFFFIQGFYIYLENHQQYIHFHSAFHVQKRSETLQVITENDGKFYGALICLTGVNSSSNDTQPLNNFYLEVYFRLFAVSFPISSIISSAIFKSLNRINLFAKQSKIVMVIPIKNRVIERSIFFLYFFFVYHLGSMEVVVISHLPSEFFPAKFFFLLQTYLKIFIFLHVMQSPIF